LQNFSLTKAEFLRIQLLLPGKLAAPGIAMRTDGFAPRPKGLLVDRCGGH
jgi:hypothetical protein